MRNLWGKPTFECCYLTKLSSSVLGVLCYRVRASEWQINGETAWSHVECSPLSQSSGFSSPLSPSPPARFCSGTHVFWCSQALCEAVSQTETQDWEQESDLPELLMHREAVFFPPFFLPPSKWFHTQKLASKIQIKHRGQRKTALT